ncbi:MAG: IS110 family transposase, partial [Spirochaetota bacterium]
MDRRISENVLKDQEIFVGLEDSKLSWKLCVRSGGIIVHETSMPAKYDILRGYFQNKFPGCKIKVIYEAGFRGFGLHDKLETDGWDCIVTPPHTVTEEKCQSQKNDRIDSRRLAKNLENKDYGSCNIPEKELRENRQISRMYEQIKKDIIRENNRIRRLLEFHGLDEDLKSGVWNQSDYKLLKENLDRMKLSPSIYFSLKVLLDKLFYLWETRKTVIKQLRELAKSEKYRKNTNLLKSVPGIGPLTAIRLVLEWGDLKRFKRKEEFSKFLGLIPREYSSGNTDHKGHITKQGTRSVRGWLIECSWVAIRHDPALLDKFNRVVKNCGSKKKAIVAVARKLALRIRAVLLSREEYIIG